MYDVFITNWDQRVAWLNDSTRWRRMKEYRFDDWCTDARQLVRETKRNSMLLRFPAGEANNWKRMGGGGPVESGRVGEHGVNYFPCASMGLKPPRLDVAQGTRASDSCLLPSSLHYRWSSMLEEPGLRCPPQDENVLDLSSVMILTRHRHWDYPPLLRWRRIHN